MADKIIYVPEGEDMIRVPYVEPADRNASTYFVPAGLQEIKVKRDADGKFAEVTMPDGVTVQVIASQV